MTMTLITKLGNYTVQISAVYSSSNVILEKRDLDLLTNHMDLFVIAGDFNAKHSDWNKPGKTLVHHEESTNLYTVIASESPAHYPFVNTHRPNVLDIALINLP